MRVDDIEADVKRDIKSTLATADTQEFLEKKIPVISTIDKSLEMFTTNGKYSHFRWAGFPEGLLENSTASKKLLYESFAAILNAIVETMPKECIRADIAYSYSHNSSPESLEVEPVAGRPDGVGVQTGTDITALEEKIQTQLDTASSLQSVGAANDKEVHEKAHEKEKEHLMRQVLIKQLDQRFVLGFVLLLDELTLVLCDRSGVMMTGTSINIHTEWKTFVRIITGFSHMSPEQLGWDTAMKIYCPLTMDIKPSYQVAHSIQGVYKHGRYKVPWVIDIEQDGKVQQYITVATISALHSKEVCDCATIVYEVVKFDEKENPKKTYALKRYWRHIQADSKQSELYPSEGEIYAILDEGKEEELKHAIAYHDIKVGGEVDNTLKLIRCDIVEEQQDGHNKLILQRDISTGNILIFEDEEGRTFGRLIDYDHAKKASGMREVPSMIAGLSPLALQDKRDLLQRLLKTTIVGKAENDVLDMALKWLRLTHACGYIECDGSIL
ncbi:hypothetical protein C0993_008532 [Termitomyces sp. T159_Od127]|nr:hypothetical protein C0993_008532 [Termitomyces sp. T159_Od127]